MNNNFFKNTYVVGEGRQNYLKIDNLEDPLFTSFTFDIDYITSPLFYTITGNDYGYPSVENIGKSISIALEGDVDEKGNKKPGMYDQFMGADQGYDILPVFSAEFDSNDNKYGFGLQKNIYMDRPLYGATEYIYMVDRRNAGFDQSDVRYSGGADNVNLNNSYKLGSHAVDGVVSASDKIWAQNQIEANEKVIEESLSIMGPENPPNLVRQEHEKHKAAMEECKKEFDEKTEYVDGFGELTESEILAKMSDYKTRMSRFEAFKEEIVEWVNSQILPYQQKATQVYNNNECMKYIMTFANSLNGDNKESYAKKVAQKCTSSFRTKDLYYGKESFEVQMRGIYNKLIRNGGDLLFDQSSTDAGNTAAWRGSKNDDGESFLLNMIQGDQQMTVRSEYVIKKFESKLKEFDLFMNLNNDDILVMKGSIKVGLGGTNIPDWATIYWDKVSYFTGDQAGYDENNNSYRLYSSDSMIKELMSLTCDVDTAFSDSFLSAVSDAEDKYYALEQGLSNIRYYLYGWGYDSEGKEYGPFNPDPNSLYGLYLAAKDVYENDEFSQCEKAVAMAEAGKNNLTKQLEAYEKATANGGEVPNRQVFNLEKQDDNTFKLTQSNIAPQTVLDMLGFITGMKNMTTHYPYIIQSITGLDTAYNNHYGIKDPYMGSGEDKITLTCLESLDLRVSSMFNRYFNAVYDRQYRRERVPVNLRRFNCSVYVHDVRSFASRASEGMSNRIIELRDMYYGAIEFKFYDCEIVPEETGNIFNDISNEAPTEMKKTNFTFTYGNCVVNFVPINQNVRYENEIGELPKIELSESITSAAKAVTLNPQTGLDIKSQG